jgi:hypothetical protein
MIGYKQQLGSAKIGSKMPLGMLRIGNKLPLMVRPTKAKVDEELTRKISGGLERKVLKR